MVASHSSSTPTKSCSSRQQPGPSGGSLCFLKGFLSHLLTLSLLRHNLLLLLYDVMLGHSYVISACNTTISALFSRCYKIVTCRVHVVLPAVYTRHVCCVYDYNVHV